MFEVAFGALIMAVGVVIGYVLGVPSKEKNDG